MQIGIRRRRNSARRCNLWGDLSDYLWETRRTRRGHIYICVWLAWYNMFYGSYSTCYLGYADMYKSTRYIPYYGTYCTNKLARYLVKNLCTIHTRENFAAERSGKSAITVERTEIRCSTKLEMQTYHTVPINLWTAIKWTSNIGLSVKGLTLYRIGKPRRIAK